MSTDGGGALSTALYKQTETINWKTALKGGRLGIVICFPYYAYHVVVVFMFSDNGGHTK